MKKSENMKMIVTKRVLLKSGTRDFQNGPPFEKIGMFLCDNHWQLFNVFNNSILKQIFLKMKTVFKKKLEIGFLVERTKIENETFPYKTALSEANVTPYP